MKSKQWRHPNDNSYLIRTWDAVLATMVGEPSYLPGDPVHELIDVATKKCHQGHKVQATEDSNSNHEFLEFLLVSAVVLYDLSDMIQGNDAGQQERQPHKHTEAQGQKDEVPRGIQVIQADEANAANIVPLYFIHSEQHDSQKTRHAPGNRVEPHCFLLDGLTAPLSSRGQEPSNGENYPPHRAGHCEKIQKHKDHAASLVLRPQNNRVPELQLLVRLVTGCAIAQQKPHKVHERNNAVTDRVVDDGSLGVSEPPDVNQKREKCEQSRTKTED